MPQKTYIPGFNDKLKQLDRYLNDWQEQLVVSADGNAEKIEVLGDLIVCVAKALLAWPKPPPVN